MKPVLDVRFFRTDAGAEPVREWLKDLPAVDRKTIGEDIKTVQFGWPLGMPLVDHLGGGGNGSGHQGGRQQGAERGGHHTCMFMMS